MKEEKITKKFWLIIIFVCICLIIFTIIGFVLYFNRKPEIVKEQLDGGTVSLNYISDISYLNINNCLPLTDDAGMAMNTEGSYFDFSVDTELDSAQNITYELIIKKVDGTVSNNDIIFYLEKEDSGSYSQIVQPSIYNPMKNDGMVILKQEVNKSIIDNYRLRTWVSEKSQISNGSYQLEINIVAKAK